jgi:hypothetical protein
MSRGGCFWLTDSACSNLFPWNNAVCSCMLCLSRLIIDMVYSSANCTRVTSAMLRTCQDKRSCSRVVIRTASGLTVRTILATILSGSPSMG